MTPQLALLGCGHIHTPGFIKTVQARNDVKIKSVWDHDAPRGQQRADELQARFFGDIRTILDDSEITGVIVCSETNRHEEIVMAAAKAGKKFIFVEKPLGMGARDAYAMADAIDKAGAKFQTGYFVRGGPMVNFIREQINKGTFGKITRIRGSNCHSGALGGWFDNKPNDHASDWRWMADPTIAGCGAFGDLGTHLLDIMLWMMGDVTEVACTLDNGTARYENCDETGEALMRFGNGTIGTLAAGWDDVANPVFLLVSGTEGHAAIIDQKLYITCKNIEGADGKAPFTKLPPEIPAGLNSFLDAMVGKPAVLVTAREAAYRSAVMEAMYQAAREKKWVMVASHGEARR
jgi:predicted dehydrogenase